MAWVCIARSNRIYRRARRCKQHLAWISLSRLFYATLHLSGKLGHAEVAILLLSGYSPSRYRSRWTDRAGSEHRCNGHTPSFSRHHGAHTQCRSARIALSRQVKNKATKYKRSRLPPTANRGQKAGVVDWSVYLQCAANQLPETVPSSPCSESLASTTSHLLALIRTASSSPKQSLQSSRYDLQSDKPSIRLLLRPSSERWCVRRARNVGLAFALLCLRSLSIDVGSRADLLAGETCRGQAWADWHLLSISWCFRIFLLDDDAASSD